MKKLFFPIVLFLFLGASAQKSSDSVVYVCPPCGGSCDTLTFNKPGVCPYCGMQLVARSTLKEQQPLSICFYLQDGVEVLDFAGPMEVFSYAGFRVFTVSRNKGPITTQGILKIMPDYSIEDAPPSDILAFFGGNAGKASRDSAVTGWVRSRKAFTQYYFSVCTGAFIAGRAGLLDSLTVTTFHLSLDDLQKAVPSAKVLSDVRFVDNGRVITTAGISAGIDGALHLVARLRGDTVARQVAAYMEYDKWVPGQGLVLAAGR